VRLQADQSAQKKREQTVAVDAVAQGDSGRGVITAYTCV